MNDNVAVQLLNMHIGSCMLIHQLYQLYMVIIWKCCFCKCCVYSPAVEHLHLFVFKTSNMSYWKEVYVVQWIRQQRLNVMSCLVKIHSCCWFWQIFEQFFNIPQHTHTQSIINDYFLKKNKHLKTHISSVSVDFLGTLRSRGFSSLIFSFQYDMFWR